MKEHLQEGEQILYVARATRITLVPLVLLLVLVAAGSGWIWYVTVEPAALWIGLAATAVISVVLLQRVIVLASNRYILTDRRVIKQTGIINRTSVDSYLDKINNVEHRQSVWGRMLGYGDVEIDTASETGMTRFPMICKPLDFKRAVLAASQDARVGRFNAPAAAPSNAQKIRDLKQLLDEGLISSEEFEAKRKQLLAEL